MYFASNIWILISRIVTPEFQVNVNDDQGVKEREGEMIEWGEKVKVVVVLKTHFYNMISYTNQKKCDQNRQQLDVKF